MSDQHRARRVQADRSVQAMAFYNGQDSQFRRVMIHVPVQGCRLHNRELLDTAVTRTEDRLPVIGAEFSIRVAAICPVVGAEPA